MYLYLSAVWPPTILVTGPFTPQVLTSALLGTAWQDWNTSPDLCLQSSSTSVWESWSVGQQVSQHFSPLYSLLALLVLKLILA